MVFLMVWRSLASKLSIRPNVDKNSQYEQGQSRHDKLRLAQALFDRSQSITRLRLLLQNFDTSISNVHVSKFSPLIQKSPPTNNQMQRLTNWLERRRSASRGRAAKFGELDNNKNNNSKRNNKITNDNENKSYLTGFRAGMTAAAAYASTRERKSANFERGASTYTSAKCMLFDRINPSNCNNRDYVFRQLPPDELLSTSSASSSLTTLSDSDYNNDGNGYWRPSATNTSHYAATTSKTSADHPNELRVDNSTPRRQIRTNPWLVNNNSFLSKIINNDNKMNAALYQQRHHNDIHNTFERPTNSCTCTSSSDNDSQRMTLSTIHSDNVVSHLSVPGMVCNAHKSDSSTSFGDSGSQPTMFFSQLLHSSTCSSGYGSQDNSPECSVHSPDWTSEPMATTSSSSSSISLRDIAAYRRGADASKGDVTVTLTGYASPFRTESQNNKCFINGGSNEEDEHIYHELESVNRLSTHSDKTLMHDGAYDFFLSLNSGFEEEPVYAVPFQRQHQRNDKIHAIYNTENNFGSNYRTLSLTSSPLSESLDEQIQFNDNSSLHRRWRLAENIHVFDEIATCGERIDDCENDYDEEEDDDNDEYEHPNDEELSTASTSSASTSCSSWTPMLKTSGASCDTEEQCYSDLKSLNPICKSYIEGEDDATTRKMLFSAAAVTRTRRLLPTVPYQPTLRHHCDAKWRVNGIESVRYKADETNMLAELDQQIIELQLQSDTVRGLVEEAKARNELRSRTRHLCMQHLRELRKLRCCVMHNHFELCI